MSLQEQNVKVRFAPSPTGYLHIGGARTALFNWLFARANNGTFVLRIEDTDQERSSLEDVNRIIESLKWLGMDWDEGPFFQSDRHNIYRQYAQKLINSGLAYYSNEKRGEHQAIIFKIPDKKVVIDDLIHGKMEFDNKLIKDLVIFKSDGTPTYNFACVIDDALMRMTHIIRGDDHISNTPKQIAVYDALGFTVPKFAHVPLILGKDKTRLSKRHGATSVQAYEKEGFLADALVNFLSLLGWSTGDDKEILSRSELIKLFSLKRVNKSNAVFDDAKLRWMNGEYIKNLSLDEFKSLIAPFIEKQLGILPFKHPKYDAIMDLMKERIRVLTDIGAMSGFLFTDDFEYDEKSVRKRLLKPDSHKALSYLVDELEQVKIFSPESVENAVRSISEKLGISLGAVIHPTRVALTGVMMGPGLFDIMLVLGKAKTIERIRKALEYLTERGYPSAQLA